MLKDAYYYILTYLKVFGGNIGVIIASLIVGVPFIAHIVACMKTKAVGMLFLGLFIFPYGWLHGLGVLLGIW